MYRFVGLLVVLEAGGPLQQLRQLAGWLVHQPVHRLVHRLALIPLAYRLRVPLKQVLATELRHLLLV